MLEDRDFTNPQGEGQPMDTLARRCQYLETIFNATLRALAATIEQRELHRVGHYQRVTALACAIAAEMGLPEPSIQTLQIAATVHDIGLLCVPLDVFSQTSRLSDIQQMAVRIHPTAGYEVVKKIPFEHPVSDIVLQHHERLDGSGYPCGLVGDQILLEARILAVADVVEAMSSQRAYRPALGLTKAINEIQRNAGKLYDAEVVKTCVSLFESGKFVLEPMKKD